MQHIHRILHQVNWAIPIFSIERLRKIYFAKYAYFTSSNSNILEAYFNAIYFQNQKFPVKADIMLLSKDLGKFKKSEEQMS